jgi:hypothetical protein
MEPVRYTPLNHSVTHICTTNVILILSKDTEFMV